MTTAFVATAQADTVSAFHYSQMISFVHTTIFGFGVIVESTSFSDANEPYNGVVEDLNSSASALSLFNQLSGQMLAIVNSYPPPQILFVDTQVVNYFELFDDTSVSYASSNVKVFVDLEAPVQHGGFAEGDVLTNVFEVTGSAFDDVIRGSNPGDY